MNKLTAKDFKRGIRVVKSQLTDFDNYPVYQNSLKPLGFYSKYNVKANTVFVICAGAAGDIGFSNKNFWAADDCYYLETDKYVDSKFIYYYLLSIQNDIKRQVRQASVPRLGSDVLKSITLPSVSDNKQQEIVKILDSFTNLIDALNEELSLRQKQFEYYREKLLTFDDNIQLKEIGELCSKVDNIKWNNNIELNYIDLSSVPCKDNRIVDCQLVNRDNAPSRARQIIKTNDILFGTTRPTQMRLCVVPKEYNNQICSTGYCVLRINNMNQKYIYYCLSSLRFMDYCDLCQDGGSYPSISDGKVKAYEIPIPSLAIQQSIVEKLDAFESLISSLKEEIALRQKQYEYYREKLLTFD